MLSHKNNKQQSQAAIPSDSSKDNILSHAFNITLVVVRTFQVYLAAEAKVVVTSSLKIDENTQCMLIE